MSAYRKLARESEGDKGESTSQRHLYRWPRGGARSGARSQAGALAQWFADHEHRRGRGNGDEIVTSDIFAFDCARGLCHGHGDARETATRGSCTMTSDSRHG